MTPHACPGECDECSRWYAGTCQVVPDEEEIDYD
jgi:hypothetical protein